MTRKAKPKPEPVDPRPVYIYRKRIRPVVSILDRGDEPTDDVTHWCREGDKHWRPIGEFAKGGGR